MPCLARASRPVGAQYVVRWGRTASALGFLALLASALLFPAVVQPSAVFAVTDAHLHVTWEAVNRLAYDLLPMNPRPPVISTRRPL